MIVRSKRPSNRSLWVVTVVLLSSLSCCRGNQRDQLPELNGPVGEAPETAPYVPPNQAVLSLISTVAPDAPAGVLDVVSSFGVEITPRQGDRRRLILPVNGAAVLTVDELSGSATVDVELLGPNMQLLSSNRIRLASIAGTIGVLTLEISAAAPRRGCHRCSTPERLLEIPGLHETNVYWSAVGHVPERVDAPLHLAVRTTADPAAFENCLVGLGASAGSMSTQADLDLTWWVIGTPDNTEPLSFARSISGCAGVKGLELYAPEGSGTFWIE